MPKAGRPEEGKKKPDRNQTYDMRSAIGKQQHSKNKSAARCTFGTATRIQTKKNGTFKDMM